MKISNYDVNQKIKKFFLINKAQEEIKWCSPNLLKLVKGSSYGPVKIRTEANNLT